MALLKLVHVDTEPRRLPSVTTRPPEESFAPVDIFFPCCRARFIFLPGPE